MNIKVKLVHPNAKLPYRAHSTDGGWDIFAVSLEDDADNNCIVVHTGLKVEIPNGYKLTIVPRSSITKTSWIIQNSPCLIDSGFRNEILIKFRNTLSDLVRHTSKNLIEDFPYKIGDRVAQCYLEEVIPIEFTVVDELSETERGEGGFGSSGSN